MTPRLFCALIIALVCQSLHGRTPIQIHATVAPPVAVPAPIDIAAVEVPPILVPPPVALAADEVLDVEPSPSLHWPVTPVTLALSEAVFLQSVEVDAVVFTPILAMGSQLLPPERLGETVPNITALGQLRLRLVEEFQKGTLNELDVADYQLRLTEQFWRRERLEKLKNK
jgi:hypothetical protein